MPLAQCVRWSIRLPRTRQEGAASYRYAAAAFCSYMERDERAVELLQAAITERSPRALGTNTSTCARLFGDRYAKFRPRLANAHPHAHAHAQHSTAQHSTAQHTRARALAHAQSARKQSPHGAALRSGHPVALAPQIDPLAHTLWSFMSDVESVFPHLPHSGVGRGDKRWLTMARRLKGPLCQSCTKLRPPSSAQEAPPPSSFAVESAA